jgi:hypothetical protein
MANRKCYILDNSLRLYFKRQHWKDVSFFRNKINEVKQTIELIYSDWTIDRKRSFMISRYPDFYFGLEESYQKAYLWSLPECMKFRISISCQTKLPPELIRHISSFLIHQDYLMH